MKTVIMAGGKGTRISELFPNIPKPLIPISNGRISKPVLEWEIESLREQGFDDIIITISHMADKIKEYFRDGSDMGVNIDYFIEEVPLGNAGALYKIKEKLSDDFLLLIADAMFDIDFNRMVSYHLEKNALATMFTHPNSHPYDSSLLITNEDNIVIQWLNKEDSRPEYFKNRVNAGIQVLNKNILSLTGIEADLIGTLDSDGRKIKVDMDRQVLKPLCGTKRLFCYDSPEYCKDMGTPERFKQVTEDFQRGIVRSKNLLNQQKAIFLDRDGTINKHVGFLRNIDEFELLPGVARAIKKINNSGFLAIVITNQPVIARGEITREELELIHNKMETLLGEEGAYLDAIYYCPHHPDKGYEGEIPELKFECNCRKPKPGMLLEAANKYNINLEKSWMIGDEEKDIEAGKSANCKTALIGDIEYGQDLSSISLEEVINKII